MPAVEPIVADLLALVKPATLLEVVFDWEPSPCNRWRINRDPRRPVNVTEVVDPGHDDYVLLRVETYTPGQCWDNLIRCKAFAPWAALRVSFSGWDCQVESLDLRGDKVVIVAQRFYTHDAR
jgi:hypothetical protein